MSTYSPLDKSVKTGSIVLGLVFLSILLFESMQDYSLELDTSVSVAKDESQQVETEQIPVLPPINDYAEIIQRPLFMDDRRPYVPEENTPAPKAPERKAPVRKTQEENFSLSAIIITDEKRLALIQSGRDKKLQKVSQGEVLNGWTLTDIQAGKITLEKSGEVKQLELAVKSSPNQGRPARAPTKTENKPANVTIVGDKSTQDAPTSEAENKPPD